MGNALKTKASDLSESPSDSPLEDCRWSSDETGNQLESLWEYFEGARKKKEGEANALIQFLQAFSKSHASWSPPLEGRVLLGKVEQGQVVPLISSSDSKTTVGFPFKLLLCLSEVLLEQQDNVIHMDLINSNSNLIGELLLTSFAILCRSLRNRYSLQVYKLVNTVVIIISRLVNEISRNKEEEDLNQSVLSFRLASLSKCIDILHMFTGENVCWMTNAKIHDEKDISLQISELCSFSFQNIQFYSRSGVNLLTKEAVNVLFMTLTDLYEVPLSLLPIRANTIAKTLSIILNSFISTPSLFNENITETLSILNKVISRPFNNLIEKSEILFDSSDNKLVRMEVAVILLSFSIIYKLAKVDSKIIDTIEMETSLSYFAIGMSVLYLLQKRKQILISNTSIKTEIKLENQELVLTCSKEFKYHSSGVVGSMRSSLGPVMENFLVNKIETHQNVNSLSFTNNNINFKDESYLECTQMLNIITSIYKVKEGEIQTTHTALIKFFLNLFTEIDNDGINKENERRLNILKSSFKQNNDLKKIMVEMIKVCTSKDKLLVNNLSEKKVNFWTFLLGKDFYFEDDKNIFSSAFLQVVEGMESDGINYIVQNNYKDDKVKDVLMEEAFDIIAALDIRSQVLDLLSFCVSEKFKSSNYEIPEFAFLIDILYSLAMSDSVVIQITNTLKDILMKNQGTCCLHLVNLKLVPCLLHVLSTVMSRPCEISLPSLAWPSELSIMNLVDVLLGMSQSFYLSNLLDSVQIKEINNLSYLAIESKTQILAIFMYVILIKLSSRTNNNTSNRNILILGNNNSSNLRLAGELVDSYVKLLHSVKIKLLPSTISYQSKLQLLQGIQLIAISSSSSLSNERQNLFLDRGIIVHIVNLVNSIETNSIGQNVHFELCWKALQTITCLLHKNEKAQGNFNNLMDYESLVEIILQAEENKPSKTTVNLLLNLMIDSLENENNFQSWYITNRSAVTLIFSLLLKCEIDIQHYIVDHFIALLSGSCSVVNLDICCHHTQPPLIDQILDILLALESSVLEKMAKNVLSLLGAHSISSRQLKRLFLLIQSNGEYRPPYSSILLSVIQQTIMPSRGVSGINDYLSLQGPRRYFYFDGLEYSGLQIKYVNKNEKGLTHQSGIPSWPSVGFSFSTWIYIDSFSNPQQKTSEISSPKPYNPYIFHFLDSLGNSVELYIENQELVYAVNNRQNIPKAILRTKVKIEAKVWFHLTITHSSPSLLTLSSRGDVSLFINSKLLFFGSTNYPKLSSNKIDFAFIATNGADEVNILYSDLERKLGDSSLQGKMGALYLISKAINTECINNIFLLGPDYMSGFDSIIYFPTFSDDEGGSSQANNSKLPPFDGYLKGEVLFQFNACVVEGDVFLDNTNKNDRQLRWNAKGVYAVNAKRKSGTYTILTRNAKETVDSIGGIAVLLPLFAQFDLKNVESDDYSIDPNLSGGLLALIHAVLRNNVLNQRFMRLQDGFSVLAYLLCRVSPQQMTPAALQTLILMFKEPSFALDLHDSLIKNIFLDFKLWIYTSIEVQDQLLQFLLEYILSKDPKYKSLISIQDICSILGRFYWYKSTTALTKALEEKYTMENTKLNLSVWSAVKEVKLHNISKQEVGKRPTEKDLVNLRNRLWDIAKAVSRNNYAIQTDDVQCIISFINAYRQFEGNDNEIIELLNFSLHLLISSEPHACQFVLGLSVLTVNQNGENSPTESSSVRLDGEKIQKVISSGSNSGFDIYVSLLSSANESIRCLALQIIGIIVATCRSHDSGKEEQKEINLSKRRYSADKNKGNPVYWAAIGILRGYETYLYSVIQSTCLLFPVSQEIVQSVFAMMLGSEIGENFIGNKQIKNPSALTVFSSLLANSDVSPSVRQLALVELRLLLNDADFGLYNCDAVLRSRFGWQAFFLDILKLSKSEDDVLSSIVFGIFKSLHVFAIYRVGQSEVTPSDVRPGVTIVSETFSHLEFASSNDHSLPHRSMAITLMLDLVSQIHSELEKTHLNTNACTSYISFSSILQLSEYVHRFLLIEPGVEGKDEGGKGDIELNAEILPNKKEIPWWAASSSVGLELLNMLEFVIIRSKVKIDKDVTNLLLLTLRVLFDLISAALVLPPQVVIEEEEEKKESTNNSSKFSKEEDKNLLDLAMKFISKLSDISVHENFPHGNHSIILQVVSKIDWILETSFLPPNHLALSALDSVRKFIVILHRQKLGFVRAFIDNIYSLKFDEEQKEKKQKGKRWMTLPLFSSAEKMEELSFEDSPRDSKYEILCNSINTLSARDPVSTKGMSWIDWETHMNVLIDNCSALIEDNKAIIDKISLFPNNNNTNSMLFDLSNIASSQDHIRRPSFLFIPLSRSKSASALSINDVVAGRNQNTASIQGALDDIERLQETFKQKYFERLSESQDLVSVLFSSRISNSYLMSSSKWKYCDRAWYRILSSLTNERGAWGSGGRKNISADEEFKFWKLSRIEDLYRRHFRMRPNSRGTRYLEASPSTENAFASHKSLNTTLVKSRTVGNEGQLLLDLRAASALGLGFNSKTKLESIASGGDGDVESELFPSPEISKQENLMRESMVAGKRKSIRNNLIRKALNDYNFSQLKKSFECELITPMMVTKGKIDLYTTHLVFTRDPKYDDPEEEAAPLRKKKKGMDTRNLLKRPSSKQWNLIELCIIEFRRYQLRHVAVELFMNDTKTFFFNLLTKKNRDVFDAAVRQLKPVNLEQQTSRTARQAFSRSGIKKRWEKRELSNFEYIMLLNRLSGRTYNDLAQYPIFPWVIADYTSSKIDLSNPKTYRNFSKPMGAQRDDRVEHVKSKYEMLSEEHERSLKAGEYVEEIQMITGPPRHYGTHYSNPQSVIWYLMRIEPFTAAHIVLQDGKFDHPDRQFHSVNEAYKGVTSNDGDVKELVPEWYYLPEMFRNKNKFDLGSKQSGDVLNDVVLPPWAATPEEFVAINLAALESEYTSAHLHEWIDLIFGYKQSGPQAVESINVFHHFTYEGSVDLDFLATSNLPLFLNCVSMIENFGQTPVQILVKPHSKRAPPPENVPIPMFSKLNLNCAKYGTRIGTEEYTKIPADLVIYPQITILGKNPLVFCAILYSLDTLITIDSNRIFGIHKWKAETPSKMPPFSLEIDFSFLNTNLPQKQLGLPYALYTEAAASTFSSSGFHQLVAVSRDEKYIFSCGHWDHSFKVTAITVGGDLLEVQSIEQSDIVTCIAISLENDLLITGCLDSTVIIWELLSDKNTTMTVSPLPLHILYGHDAAVNAVACSVNLDLVVSASDDGSIIIHSLLKGTYTFSIFVEYNVSVISRSRSSTGFVNVNNGKPSRPRIEWVAIASFGNIISYSGDDFTIRSHSINGEFLSFVELTEKLYSFTLSEDGNFFITGGDRKKLVARCTRTLKEISNDGDCYYFKPFLNLNKLAPFEASIRSCMLTDQERHLIVGLANGELWIIAPDGCYFGNNMTK